MFKLPPHIKNHKNRIRKVGFELEFSDLSLNKTLNVVQKVFGGEKFKINDYFFKVKNSSVGDFEIKIDTSILTEEKFKKANIKLPNYSNKADFYNTIGNLLKKVFSTVVPYEIVSPPFKITELDKIELLRKELLKHNASGTKQTPLYAFGIHINPEMPDLKLNTIKNYLRAFILLFPWLRKQLKVDITRRLTHFINPFPKEYCVKLLDENYLPDFDNFLKDYNKFNPDRNRPLDLYPLFAEINHKKVNKLKGVGKLNARPTLHYRLPNSLIDNKNWSLAEEWNYWIIVENLAYDENALNKFSKKFIKIYDDTFLGFANTWRKEINKWVKTKK